MLGAVAICVAYGLLLTLNITSWGLEDADAYWLAADRLRSGGELYVANVPDPALYRYAPWFAWLWVPLTAFPKDAVMAAWSVVLLASCVACVWPMLRTRTPEGLALTFLLGGLLIRAASTGNAQPLLLAAMMYAGPVGIALAASMKIAPIFAVLGYIGERRWWAAAVTVGLTVLLAAPMLLYNLSAYPVDPNDFGEIVWYWPLGIVGAVVALRSERYRWLGASMAVMFLVPRLYPYTLSYLLLSRPTTGCH